MKKREFIPITQADLKEIIGEDFLKKIEKNCYCNCEEDYMTTIVNYTAQIDDLGDTLLKGHCKKCGKRINRYLETSESLETLERVKKIIQKLEEKK
jgi:hypothetical protein